MRLIDIEPVLKAAELAGKELVSIDLLKDFEQVDAVPVVRCKDCKHNGTWQCHMEYDEYHPEADIHHEMHGDDDFCSYGKRKENT